MILSNWNSSGRRPPISSANREGIRFSPEETSLILEILKEGRSPEEKKQIDSMVSLVMAQMNRRKK